MAREERSPADSLITAESVAASATRYGFVGAVALLERLHPDAPMIGGLGPAAEEVVRFRHDPALTFSAGDVSRISVVQRAIDPTNALSPKRATFEVVTTFLGLTGSATPLPLYFAEEVATEDPDAPAQRDFLDLFHHRLLSLLYRLRAKYDYASEFTSDAADSWSRRVLALAGVDVYDRAEATSLPRWQLLRLSPLLANRARTRRTLEVALDDVLSDVLEGATVQIEQFAGRWVEIELRQRMKLGLGNHALGEETVIGDRIFDRGGKFRVTLGPLNGKAFRRFLPDGDQIDRVRDVIGLFSRDQLEFDLELVLGKDATPTLRLAQTDGSKLGLDSWLGSQGNEETRVVVDVPFLATPRAAAPASDADGSEPPAPSGLTSADLFDSSAYSSEPEEQASQGFHSGEGHHAR